MANDNLDNLSEQELFDRLLDAAEARGVGLFICYIEDRVDPDGKIRPVTVSDDGWAAWALFCETINSGRNISVDSTALDHRVVGYGKQYAAGQFGQVGHA